MMSCDATETRACSMRVDSREKMRSRLLSNIRHHPTPHPVKIRAGQQERVHLNEVCMCARVRVCVCVLCVRALVCVHACVRACVCVCVWVGNEKGIRSEEGWSASLVRPAPLISMRFHLSCDH